MKNIKCLITAGCSYSQVPNTDVTWPVHLTEYLQPEEVHYLGQGAAGNGVISRKLLYTLNESLKKYKSDEILVGVMWSGYDRREYYSKHPIVCHEISYGIDVYGNPINIMGPDRNWHLINRHWNDPLTTGFMENLFNDEDSLIITIEHILRVQTFLKYKGIKYFMTEYDHDVFDVFPYKGELVENCPDVKYLFDQIDKSYWLPITNCYDWSKYESGFDFARPPDPHPSTKQHKALTERIIIPFLLDKKMVYDIL
jgi:hypothetical protein